MDYKPFLFTTCLIVIHQISSQFKNPSERKWLQIVLTIKSDKWLSCRAQMFSIPFKCWGKWNLVWLKEYASGEMCEVFSKWSTWQPCWISECNGLSNIWSTTCSISQTQILFNSFNIFEGNLHWKIFLLWRQWNFLVAMTTKTSVKQNYLFWP